MLLFFCNLYLAIAVIGATISVFLGTLKAAADLHQLLLHNIFRVSMTFFYVTPVGRVLSRFSQDTNTVDCNLPDNFRMALRHTFWVRVLFSVYTYTHRMQTTMRFIQEYNEGGVLLLIKIRLLLLL